MNELKIKRAYLPAEPTDGYRILIDRLWPRGISKEKADIDEWAKEVTPTPQLRQWFGHKPENFEAFQRDYTAELDGNAEATLFASHCQQLLDRQNVTLLYGAKSPTCNHAVILRNWILNHLKG
ncbi:MAG: DUF488 domain-containing protein [Prevotella sp.]|nr:DUF488 domain-containing protein [Prevotella sp.]